MIDKCAFVRFHRKDRSARNHLELHFDPDTIFSESFNSVVTTRDVSAGGSVRGRELERSMKKLFTVLALLVAIYVGWSQLDRPDDSASPVRASDEILANAFDERKHGFQAEGIGIVIKILPDDNDGSRHQRFVLRLHSGQTLLIAHNIDVAPRLSSLREGDAVAFSGEYEWSSKGGVIHWTHRDPDGRHVAGWLKRKGKTYQ